MPVSALWAFRLLLKRDQLVERVVGTGMLQLRRGPAKAAPLTVQGIDEQIGCLMVFNLLCMGMQILDDLQFPVDLPDKDVVPHQPTGVFGQSPGHGPYGTQLIGQLVLAWRAGNVMGAKVFQLSGLMAKCLSPRGVTMVSSTSGASAS